MLNSPVCLYWVLLRLVCLVSVLLCVCVCVCVCVCNEAKEKSFVMPSDSVAPSTRLKLPEHNREGLGRGEGVSMIDNDR